MNWNLLIYEVSAKYLVSVRDLDRFGAGEKGQWVSALAIDLSSNLHYPHKK